MMVLVSKAMSNCSSPSIGENLKAGKDVISVIFSLAIKELKPVNSEEILNPAMYDLIRLIF